MPLQTISDPTPELAGSIFVNNTSYSGADIKVVVNLYGGLPANSAALLKATDDIAEIERDLAFAITRERASSDKYVKTKIGTQEFLRVANELNTAAADKLFLQRLLREAKERQKSIITEGAPASTKVLAEAQTLSISTHREKNAVRALGHVYPKAYVRGQREIAGSLIFTVFNEHVLYELIKAHPSDFDAAKYTSALMDQLPPVDIVVSFANEYGSVSRMGIYGVEFVNEGQVMSIEDILTENTVNYVARDIDPMRAVSQRKVDENSLLINETQPLRASDLLLEDDYLRLKEQVDPYERQRRRRFPFLQE